jgi:hypothetical protein
MIQRLAFPILLEKALSPQKLDLPLAVFLCNEGILARLLAEKLTVEYETKPVREDRITHLAAALDALATPPLFEPAAPVLFSLPEKLTKGQWKETLAALDRLHGAPSERPPLWIIGNPAQKSIIENKAPSAGASSLHLSIFISYSPQRSECARCIRQLMQRFSRLSAATADRQEEWAQMAAQTYDGDLLLIDDHFKRMQETGLPFSDVYADTPLTGVFEFIDALARDPLPLVLNRLSACSANGIDASKVLSTTHHFFRQLLRFISLRQKGTTEREAFQKLGIPFPAQAKFTAAAQNLKMTKLLFFLSNAPHLELTLRQTPRGYDHLTVEFTHLLT